MYLAQNMKYLREQIKTSQNGLAEIFKVSRSAVCNWESGKREPELSVLIHIADYFGVTLDDLIRKNLQPPIARYSENLRYLRKKHGMTQEDMAVFLGFSGKSSLCAVETGKSGISIENLEKLADFFGVTLDQMVKHDLSKEMNGHDD